MSPMANFAILRTAKLSTLGNVSASGQHNYRERPTANADGQRTKLNKHVGAASADELVKRVKARLPDKVRKNAVRCIEYLITASPEAFTGDNATNPTQYFNDALKWLKKRHGAANVVAASVHNDETTPHLVAYVVPRIGDRLNCREFLGGRQKLSEMQTDFAKAVGAKHGLERGIEKRGATHKTIKAWYAEQKKAREAAPELAKIDLPLTNLKLVREANLNELAQLASVAHTQIEELKRAKGTEGQALALGMKVGVLEDYGKRMINSNNRLIKIIAGMLKEQPKAELAKLMQVELRGKADVFDALIREGKASNFAEAVALTAEAYNAANETSIEAAAEWVEDYNTSPSGSEVISPDPADQEAEAHLPQQSL